MTLGVGCSGKHGSILTLCFSKHILRLLLKGRHQGKKKTTYKLVEVCAVRSLLEAKWQFRLSQ